MLDVVRSNTQELWQERVQFSDWFLQSEYQSGNVIFLDETGFKVTMRRRASRTRRGEEAQKEVAAIKSRNITVMAAINYSGLTHYKVLSGNGNGEAFVLYLTELLDNLVEENRPYTLVMDFVAFHRIPALGELVNSRGCEIKFLPAFSPFFNPIENIFSQWKYWVRSFEPKNEAELREAMTRARERISSEHCSNSFRHADSNCQKCIQGERNLY